MTTLDKAIIIGLLAGLVIYLVTGDWKKQLYEDVVGDFPFNSRKEGEK